MWSKHSCRTVFTKRSEKAFAIGERIGVRMTRTPSERKTSSNGPEYLASRSRIRNRALSLVECGFLRLAQDKTLMKIAVRP
jgi:hypothetical protein